MTDFDDLASLLRRADGRERARQAEEVGAMLAEVFRDQGRRALDTAMDARNDEHRLDQMRSERDSMRANELETRRLLGDALTDDEERERLDLASRRDAFGGGYYRPADGGSK